MVPVRLPIWNCELRKSVHGAAPPLAPPPATALLLKCRCHICRAAGPYNKAIGAAQDDIKKLNTRINEVIGIKESDTGLAPPSQWDLVSDKQMMQEEQPLQVGTHP